MCIYGALDRRDRRRGGRGCGVRRQGERRGSGRAPPTSLPPAAVPRAGAGGVGVARFFVGVAPCASPVLHLAPSGGPRVLPARTSACRTPCPRRLAAAQLPLLRHACMLLGVYPPPHPNMRLGVYPPPHPASCQHACPLPASQLWTEP